MSQSIPLQDFINELLKHQETKTPTTSKDIDVDVFERTDGFVFQVELPGCNKDNIQVNIDNGVLILEATKAPEKSEEKVNYFYKERNWGNFRRSFRLPVSANKDLAEVKYTDGVLIITIPKLENAGVKKLIVQ